ncbi:hypothetical protein HK100_003587, partial [Physocladia obscura]
MFTLRYFCRNTQIQIRHRRQTTSASIPIPNNSNSSLPATATVTASGTAIVDPFIDVSLHFRKITPITHQHGRVLVLNDPRLDLDAIDAISAHLAEWDADKNVKVISVIKRSSVPVFCRGINVKDESEWHLAFEKSAHLAHQIATLNTPFVSIMDGPTHGLGTALSIHAPFRISTPSTVLSFKEGPGGLGLLVPGTAFAMRQLLLDDDETHG